MHGLKALAQATNFVTIRNSYYQSGIELNFNDGKPEVKVNVNKWLTQRNSPQTEDKEEHFINTALMKWKRVETSMYGKTKKQKKDEEKQAQKARSEAKEMGEIEEE